MTYWDNEKENGNYHLGCGSKGLRFKDLGFRVLVRGGGLLFRGLAYQGLKRKLMIL